MYFYGFGNKFGGRILVFFGAYRATSPLVDMTTRGLLKYTMGEAHYFNLCFSVSIVTQMVTILVIMNYFSPFYKSLVI